MMILDTEIQFYVKLNITILVMKKLLLAILLVVFSKTLFAQQLRVAPVFGLNISHGLYSSSYKGMIELSYDNAVAKYKPVAGIVLGAVGEYPLTEQFSVRSGLLLNLKGSRIKLSAYDMDSYESEDVKFRLSYLEIPILAAYRLGSTGLTVSAGPSLGFAVGGKVKSDWTYTYDDDTEHESESSKLRIGSNGVQHDLKPLEVSFNFAIAKQLTVAERDLEVSVNVQPSISKWNTSSKIEPDIWIRNIVIGFRAAYFFSF